MIAGVSGAASMIAGIAAGAGNPSWDLSSVVIQLVTVFSLACMQRMYACMYACMYVCMHVCMHVCMYVYMHVCMYLCIYESMYVCMYVCMNICIYVYV